MRTTPAIAALFVLASTAAAQQPPRPAEHPRSVTLTLAEYNRLVDLANRPPQGAPPPPVAAVVSGADLRIRIDRDTARGTFTLTGDTLREGTSRVPLLSGATLIDATAAGRPLPLVLDGTAQSALVPGPASFALTLDWGAPIAYRPGRASFVLPVPQSGTARTTIDVPGEQADVRLSAGLITRRTVAGGRTIVDATLDPGSSTEVSWSMRDSAPVAAARERRALAEVMTLVTIGDADLRMAALVDVTVVQGELRTLTLRLPAGYEMTGVSGSTVDTSAVRDGELRLTLSEPAARSHQLLVTLERPYEGGSTTIDSGVVGVRDMQRERGEIAIEGAGTLDLAAAEREGMQRIDVRELPPPLQTMSRLPLLAAFRYQRTSALTPAVAMTVRRFADTSVLAAVADSARVTTMVTTEGRALTEIVLRVQNRAQPFLKVALPPGATMVSVDVAGERAKPVLGTDGTRVPLLRAGFRPSGPYEVSFVYVHAGTPFERKGDIRMPLPTMDIPIGLVEWEMFFPEQYTARAVDGNVLTLIAANGASMADAPTPSPATGTVHPMTGRDGALAGRVVDASGGVLPGVTVTMDAGGVNRSTTTDAGGMYAFTNVPAGPVSLQATLAGFTPARAGLRQGAGGRRVDFTMRTGALAETVVVMGEMPVVDVQSARSAIATGPSDNVVNLQRRTAGVLPVRIDVPRAGRSHRFIKPLVIDQETFVTLRYRRR